MREVRISLEADAGTGGGGGGRKKADKSEKKEGRFFLLARKETQRGPHKKTCSRSRTTTSRTQGKTKKDTRKSSLSLVNTKENEMRKKGRRRRQQQETQKTFSKRCDVMVSKCSLSIKLPAPTVVLLSYADDETGIGPGDAVDTPFKKQDQIQ